MNTLITDARHTDLATLREVLVNQHAHKVDFVTGHDHMAFIDGNLVIDGIDSLITVDGVSDVNGIYEPTGIFDEGLADKLKIPLSYLRRMATERPDLYDANANGWLVYDERSFLIRTFQRDDDRNGIARSLHSAKYGIIDNLDVLTAALSGIREAGVEDPVFDCDLTDRKMIVRVRSEAVNVLAPTLLAGYRSPFTGATGTDNPTVFAGFVLSNSETGNGAFSITPQVVVQVCLNGMTIKKDAMRAVHLGGEQQDGRVDWSQDTISKQLALITAKARDSIEHFMTTDYLTDVVADLEEKAGVKLSRPTDVHLVTKKLGFSQQEADDVFNMFIEGGQITAGGVMQAVSAAAKNVVDADRANDIEGEAVKALELAAAL